MANTPSDQPAIGQRKVLQGVTIGGASALAGPEALAYPTPPKAVAATLPGPKLIAADMPTVTIGAEGFTTMWHRDTMRRLCCGR